MYFKQTIIAGGVILATLGAACADDAFSWTGSYEGMLACDDVTGGEFSTFARSVTASVQQTETEIQLEISAVVDASEGVTSSTYRGGIMYSPAGDVASGYLEACRVSFPYKELVRIFPASVTGETFAFSADTIFVSEAVPGTDDKLIVESCRWSLTRISTETPSLNSC